MRLKQIEIIPPSHWINRPTRSKLLLNVEKLFFLTEKTTPDFKIQKATEETNLEKIHKIKEHMKMKGWFPLGVDRRRGVKNSLHCFVAMGVVA